MLQLDRQIRSHWHKWITQIKPLFSELFFRDYVTNVVTRNRLRKERRTSRTEFVSNCGFLLEPPMKQRTPIKLLEGYGNASQLETVNLFSASIALKSCIPYKPLSYCSACTYNGIEKKCYVWLSQNKNPKHLTIRVLIYVFLWW